MIWFDLLLQNIDHSARDKIPISRRHFCEVKRCTCLEAMLHIVDDILRCENYIHANIAQRQMKDRWRVLEHLFIGKIRGERSCGEKNQRGVRDGVLQTASNIRLEVVPIAKSFAETLGFSAVHVV